MKNNSEILNEMILINEKATRELSYKVLEYNADLDDLSRSKGYSDPDGLLTDFYKLSPNEYKLDKSKHKLYIKSDSIGRINLNELVKDTDANISEFYGIIQLDGTEPDANGEYNSDYSNVTSVGSINNTDKKKPKLKSGSTEDDQKQQPKTKSTKSSKKKKPPKSNKNESTDSSDIPSNNVSTIDKVCVVSDHSPVNIIDGKDKKKKPKLKN